MWEPPALVSGTWQRIATFLYSKKEKHSTLLLQAKGIFKARKARIFKKSIFSIFFTNPKTGYKEYIVELQGL